MASVPASVECREVCRSYGKQAVLQHLNLTLKEGQVYGLLGPSGCGKTTLLKCILGKLKISHGSIRVLEKPPAFPGHEVPGRMVGYMPQDLALYHEISISETFYFFGRIHGMSTSEIKQRTSFLIAFLNLPESSRIVKKLSGGQQRRVSLGVALLQGPQLLILDEPTVGVDPVLRARIWQHLMNVVEDGKVSVIITTHYIEEARQAHMVGLMRNGKLLAEAPPDLLMTEMQVPTLEMVFLNLCKTTEEPVVRLEVDGKITRTKKTYSIQDSDDDLLILQHENSDGEEEQKDEKCHEHELKADWKMWGRYLMPKFRNIIALMIKTFMRMKRMPGFLCFQFLLPVIQIALICLCIGGDPKHLPVAVVNNETGNFSLSHRFLQHLDNKSIHQVHLNQAAALTGARNGLYWAIIGFGVNYTQSLFLRMVEQKVDPSLVESSSVHVWLDMTNQQIAFTVEQKLQEAFQGFAKDMLGNKSYLASLPVKFEEPIYGSRTPDFTDFIAPGAILSITFFWAVGLTALSFVTEKKCGLLDRCWVTGVSSLEIMLAHLLSHLFTMAVQIIAMLLFVFLVFKVPNHGSLVLIVLLTFLQGITGISFGLAISAAIDDEQSANQAAMGIFYPNLILSGIVWPMECIPYPLRYLSISLPQTYASEALRSIFSKGNQSGEN
ncbi:ABC transporter G family member 23-like isoform X2 [Protopterus annectens]|uniref:ABC transporter G family member 23-like isoform X2 n=1 Tax=Protopterus annectens TaxID=7888 RepID=UPI001CFBE42D|nr:ABC transporter G family member 23-like isoform X2 [Protopterus annectens]